MPRKNLTPIDGSRAKEVDETVVATYRIVEGGEIESKTSIEAFMCGASDLTQIHSLYLQLGLGLGSGLTQIHLLYLLPCKWVQNT